MKIEIHIERKHVACLVLTLAILVGVNYVIAFGTNNPPVFGHTWGEMECDKCVGTGDLADSSVTSVKIAAGGVTASDIGDIGDCSNICADSNAATICDNSMEFLDGMGNCVHPPDSNSANMCDGEWVFLSGSGECKTDRYAPVSCSGSGWKYTGASSCSFSCGGGTSPQCKTYTCLRFNCDGSRITSVETATCYDLEACVVTCFAAGTKITVADGSKKNIEDVKAGDHVLSYNEVAGEQMVTTVTKTFEHSSEEFGDYYLVINGKLRVTPNHPLYVNGEWQQAGSVRIGDVLLGENSEPIPVKDVEKVYDKIVTYNLEVSGQGEFGSVNNYYADGVLAHNKPD